MVEVSATSPDLEVTQEWGTTRPSGRRDLTITVTHTGADPVIASVVVTASLPAADPFWLMPGLFYGENRPAGCVRVYPRFEAGASRPEELVSDSWEFRADRAATPAVLVWGDAGGVALLGEETTAVGVTGLALSHAEGVATIGLRLPFAEAPVTYYGSAQPRPAQVAAYTWQPGETRAFTVGVAALPDDRHAYASLLREDWALRVPSAPVSPWVDVATAAEVAAEGLHRWHYDPDPGVLLETVGFDREVSGRDGRSVDRQAMHVGWVSGIPWAYALLRHGVRVGNGAYVEAARRVIDLICDNPAPCGTFWGTWYREHGWSQSWTPIKGGLHARTLGEATLFLGRALAEHPGPASWERAYLANLDAVVARQREDGNLGSVHDAHTGQVVSWQGASGLVWVAALAEAAAHDDDARYLAAAERAGDYYARFVLAELICGAPEDVDLAPTSEDGYCAVLAYVALWRRTGAGRWLDLARRAADWMLTFRYTYNVSFPERTPLAVHGFATRGGDQASPSNQHLHAYGLVCTAELVELARALEDPFYADRAWETLACFRQLLPVEDGQLNGYRGMVTERYYQTECFQPKGMYLTLSHAWSAGVLLLACEQALGA
jgi:hypothetical protein